MTMTTSDGDSRPASADRQAGAMEICRSCRMFSDIHSLNYCEDPEGCDCECGEDDGSDYFARVPSFDAQLAAEQEARRVAEQTSCRLREALEQAAVDEHLRHMERPFGEWSRLSMTTVDQCQLWPCKRATVALTAAPGPCVHQQVATATLRRAEAAESRVRVLEEVLLMQGGGSKSDPDLGWHTAECWGERYEVGAEECADWCIKARDLFTAERLAAALAGDAEVEGQHE